MGFISNTVNGVRKYFRNDKERVAFNVAKSATNSPISGDMHGFNEPYGNSALSEYLQLEADLLNKYADYESMNEDPIVAAAIEIYGDDATSRDLSLKRSVWVTSSDRRIQKILDDLFQKTLRIEEEIWEIARNLCQYGSSFEEILITGNGVEGLNFMPTPTIRRVEGNRGELYGFIQTFNGQKTFTPYDLQALLKTRQDLINPTSDAFTQQHLQQNIVALEPFEVAHFRLKGSSGRKSVYGGSILEPARWIWKRLVLLQDAAMIYRLQRAPERFAYYVDIGDNLAQDARAELRKFKQEFKKKKYIDPTTNKMNLRMDLLDPLEDIFIPVRKGVEGAKVQVLTSPVWQTMEDVTYFQDQLYAGLKIPKAFLGQPEGAVRASLSSLDVRFCRTVMRVQQELINGLEKICRVHLAALNINPETIDFEVHLTPPSSILELGQMEVRNAQAAFAQSMGAFVSQHWILSKVFNMSDSEIQSIMKQQEDDQERMMQTQLRAQMQAQMMQAQMMQQAGGAPQGDPNAAQAPQTAPQGPSPFASNPTAQPQLFSSYFPSNMNGYLKKNITERELFRGNKTHEKEIENNLEEVLSTNKDLKRKLGKIQETLNDMKARGIIKPDNK